MNTILVLPVMVSGLGMRPGRHLQIGFPSLDKTVQHPLNFCCGVPDPEADTDHRIRTSDEQIRIRIWIGINTKIAVTFRMQKRSIFSHFSRF